MQENRSDLPAFYLVNSNKDYIFAPANVKEMHS